MICRGFRTRSWRNRPAPRHPNTTKGWSAGDMGQGEVFLYPWPWLGKSIISCRQKKNQKNGSRIKGVGSHHEMGMALVSGYLTDAGRSGGVVSSRRT